MINLTLDRHDFLCAIEGFAHGSHLRQHVWRDIVYRSFPQMSSDDKDYLWFFLRRDVFPSYFYELNGKQCTHVGHEDFIHALAVLHRGNRYTVTFNDGKTKTGTKRAICYRFNGSYRPLYVLGSKIEFQKDFDAFIPNDWVIEAEQHPMSENKYVEQGKEQWWNDLSIYDNIKTLQL